jgi:Asp-tRNA(Asn)/Glu-tRNA(Gln) amidotransferase A subunit family amidase
MLDAGATDTFSAWRTVAFARRRFLALLGAGAAGAALTPHTASPSRHLDEAEDLAATARLLGLPFREEHCEQAERSTAAQRRVLDRLREIEVAWDESPSFTFDPLAFVPIEERRDADGAPLGSPTRRPARPLAADVDVDLAYATIDQLGRALRDGSTTSRRLVEIALARLEQHDATLHCVVTLLREEALAAADRADDELRRGEDRGPLHGIPFGAKDLFAWPGAPTTFGAAPLRDQNLGDARAVVLARLADAGAVLVAKLSLGALAMGDVWFGGTTRNPWNPERGSSGSSAGSAAAVAAGLLPFALGTETNGSILSPATRCGVTALRPTFGQVPRAGAMPLVFTMDKVGVLARAAQDAALVHRVLAGPDPRDPCSGTRPLAFAWPAAADEAPSVAFSELEVAVLREPEDAATTRFVDWLRERGARVAAFTPPDELDRVPIGTLVQAVLLTEASAACDGLLFSGGYDALTRQDDGAWPNLLRTARIVPAADYLHAMRARTGLVRGMARAFARADVVVGAGRGNGLLTPTNFTGQPALVLPAGDGAEGSTPPVVTLFGRLDQDALLLAIGAAWQSDTDFHLERPRGYA